MSKITLVTCLFDLARREGSSRRKIEDYFRFGEFILGLDQDIAFFVEPDLASRVLEERRSRGRLKRTYIIPMTMEDLVCTKYLESIRKSRPAGNGNPVKDTSAYTLLGWSKFELLERAAVFNVFGSSHLAWVDFGIAHVARTNDPAAVEPFANPPDLVRMHMLKYFDENDVRNYDYWEFRRGHLAGGFIVGNVENILALTASFWTTAEIALANNYCPTEDCILPVIAARERSSFTFSYGDYEDIFLNHVRVRGNGWHLLFQMRDARERKAWNHGLAVGREIIASHRDGTFGCDEATLEPLIMEYFIAAYYGSTREEALQAATYYAHLTERNSVFRSLYFGNRDFVKNNFSCLGTPILLPET